MLLDEADGRPSRGVRLRLGAKAFEEGLWRPETGSQRADGAPFVMQTESWEAAAIARRGGDAATRGRLRAKYKGVVFRDTDATFDEVRVVEDVVASGDGDYWELSTQLVDGGDDEPPLPYGIAALMPMVAAGRRRTCRRCRRDPQGSRFPQYPHRRRRSRRFRLGVHLSPGLV